MQAAPIAQNAPLVRYRTRRAKRAQPDTDALAGLYDAHAVTLVRHRPRRKAATAELQVLLEALEAPAIDDEARARLQRLLDRHGAEHVTLLIRTIIESEGNAGALSEPIISAVSSVMVFHKAWPDRGLSWIAAFDTIPLAALLQTMRDLDLFEPASLGHYLFLVLRNRLAKVFEPPAAALTRGKRPKRI